MTVEQSYVIRYLRPVTVTIPDVHEDEARLQVEAFLDGRRAAGPDWVFAAEPAFIDSARLQLIEVAP
ncbi:hypothetical protein [Stackebrandtia soli]|uniref:hypothetical protein n=1 Tax=Stackebrandtia soli TaxID=1892856 RepID=UPI0039E79AB5